MAATSTIHQKGGKDQFGDTVEGYTPTAGFQLKYPKDLSTEEFYPDAVCFTIMKRIGVSVEDVTSAMSGVFKMGSNALSKGFGSGDIDVVLSKPDKEKLNKIISSNKPEETKRQEYMATMQAIAKSQSKELPESFFELAVDAIGKFGEGIGDAQKEAANKKLNRKSLNVRKTSGNSDILGSIYMNMPSGVQFSDKANWGSQELGLVGKTVKSIIGGGDVSVGGSVAGMGGNIAAAGVGGIGALVTKMGLKGGLVGMAVGAAAAGSTLQKGAEAALGISMNPYLEMMFSGIAFRDMQFDFIMRPRSADEFTDIEKIIRLFREHSRPSWVGGKMGKSFMNYPMVYNIQFLTTEGTGSAESYKLNPNVPKLKTCVCDSVTTNYSPQNMWTAHENGVPVAVTLGLHFQETELVMAKDVQGGGF